MTTHEINGRVLGIIEDLVKNSTGNVQWKEIVEAVNSDTSFEVDNWMKVRGVLQLLIDDGVCTRTDDLRVEEYLIDKGNL